jgi:tRNA threonylcarbamoyl adenosine modification protein YeaZ
VILAIEAASTDLSLAIADPGGAIIGDDAWTSERRQSAELLPRLLALLDREGRTIDEVTGIGVGSGPGSFTGLRVAMALAKGLAVALRCPLVAVPSLVAWLEADPAAELAIARAGANDAFVQGRGADGPVILDREALAGRADGTTVVAPVELVEAFALEAAHSPRGAVSVARTAAARLADDPRGDDVRTVEPIYLRAPRGVAAGTDGEVRWL